MRTVESNLNFDEQEPPRRIEFAMTEIRITKLEASRLQLERAITLFVEQKDYVSVITLAGAAEEILGHLLLQKGGELNIVQAWADAFRFAEPNESGEVAPRRDVIDELNRVRNWLKHFQDGSDLEFDPNLSAQMLLLRAITNYMMVANGPTEPMSVFIQSMAE